MESRDILRRIVSALSEERGLSHPSPYGLGFARSSPVVRNKRLWLRAYRGTVEQ